MTPEEVTAFWVAFDIFYRSRDNRKGQAMMNALREVAPELYDEITGSYYDCFYNDGKVGAFRDYLGI
jgi:hypothetical protein